jgi:hypothetical protein
MFEIAGWLFSISEVIGTIIGLLAFNAAGILFLIVRKGKTPMSVASDILNTAVGELENSASALASAIEAFIAARADNDDEAMLAASNRIKAISENIRGQTAKLVV